MPDGRKTCSITTVAMGFTGVCCLVAFEIPEAAGCNVILVNARDANGRMTDVTDVLWLQKLHAFAFFGQASAPVRSYLKQWGRVTEYRAGHIQHMKKALMHMNVQLHHAVAEITGVSGFSIVRAIVGYEGNP